MKNKFTLLIVFFLTSFMAANAQFASGKYLLGGDLGFSSEKTKGLDPKNQVVNISVKVGKFIKENNAIGINLSYSHIKSESLFENGLESKQYGAGIFYRKYKSLSKDFHLFGEGQLNYNNSETTYDYTNYVNTVNTNGVSINFTPGISYSLTKKLQIELLMPSIIGIGYTSEKNKFATPQTPGSPGSTKNRFEFYTNLNSNILSSFGIGFKFIL